MAAFPIFQAKKTVLLLGAALMLALLLAGCSGNGDADGDEPVQTSGGPSIYNTTPIGIHASGSGVASGEPDIAVVSLGVEALRDSVSEARSDAASALGAVVAALREAGVAEDDIRTAYFSINPRYEYLREGGQELLGFQVTNTLNVTVRDLNATGDIVDSAAAAGGDLIRVQSVSFQVEDTSALEEEALINAIQDAEKKADVYARELEVVRGGLLSVAESYEQPYAFPEARFAVAAMDSAGPPTQFFAGDIEVRVSVQAVFAIE